MPGANSFKRIRSSECFELFLCVCVFWRVGVCMLWRIVVHVSERKFLVSQCAWCVCRCLSSGGTRQQWPTGSGVKFIEIALYLCLSRKLTKRHNAHDLAGVYSKSDSDWYILKRVNKYQSRLQCAHLSKASRRKSTGMIRKIDWIKELRSVKAPTRFTECEKFTFKIRKMFVANEGIFFFKHKWNRANLLLLVVVLNNIVAWVHGK